MGIRSLTKLIKDKSPDSIETSQYHKLSGKRVALDASLYIYQCLMNVRHNGKYFTNDKDKVTSHISGIFYKHKTYHVYYRYNEKKNIISVIIYFICYNKYK